MPRGKGAVKSVTEPRQDKLANDAGASDEGRSSVEMKDIELTAASGEEHEISSCVDIGDMSVGSTASSEKEKDLLPSKPKRLFMITGSKKKDAKLKNNHGQTDVNKGKSKKNHTCDADKKIQTKLDTESNNVNEDPKVAEVVKEASNREFFDDEHPYEDPNSLVNNSTTPDNKQSPKAKMEPKTERPQSPGLRDKRQKSKSNESIKTAAKTVKEKRTSIMSERSSARSIFAFLVALLLSLIIFLSFFFLLHSDAVLSVVVAILVFLVVFTVLGFLDMVRIKCLILLFLPSLCSRGGKATVYLLLLYFVVKGPLCNTIGNIQTVRTSLKCVINQRPGLLEERTQTFLAAQNCINSAQSNISTRNQSVERAQKCLAKMCISVKDKFKQHCASKNPRISRRECSVANDLKCNNSQVLKTSEDCPKAPCRKEFDSILTLLGESGIGGDDCEFLGIIGMLLPLLILVLFYEAYNYEKKYRTYNNFHNYFLTGHFQCIDQGRSSCDREAVLPLKKVELRNHIRPSTVFHLTDGEKKFLYQSLKAYMVFLLFILFLILADLYTFRMFNIESDYNRSSNISKHSSNISNHSYFNTTPANNSIRISTTPANNSIRISVPMESDEIYLATVKSPGSISKIVIPVLLSILLFIILLQGHLLRFQWYVCSKLYSGREKERVFYLYNKILEDRIQLMEDCRKRMKCYHREMKTLNALEPTRILSKQVKLLSKVFKFFHINLRKCVICNDSEKPTFATCYGADCSGVYCLECSFDIDKKCLYCDTDLKRSLSVRQASTADISSRESLV